MTRHHFLPSLCGLVLALATSIAADSMRVATWNVEHLSDKNDVGCVGRSDDDYAYLAQRLGSLDAHVVALQEVESAVAAYRILPQDRWLVVMSDRPNIRGDVDGPLCWGDETKHLRHQATGIAVRRDVSHNVLPTYAHLAGDDPNQRWGTDLAVTHDDESIRLLSVHLASGCWGPEQDEDANDARICAILKGQVERLAEWIQARNAANEHFIVLGDFNRRLELDDDWAADVLLADALQTTLITAKLRDGVPQSEWCDERYPNLIDHIIVSNSMLDRVDMGATREHPRIREIPDHCIISMEIR